MSDATRLLGENPLVTTITDHVGYFTRMFPVKAAIASALAIITDVWGWEEVVFTWYCVFALIDLFLASIQAFIFGVWSPKFVRLWMSKLFFELFVIVLVSGLFHSLFAITGQLLTVANWMFLLCMITYMASILDRLHIMGAPLPAFLGPVLRAVRRRASMHLSTLLADEEVAKDLEQALAAGKASKQVETNQDEKMPHDFEIPAQASSGNEEHCNTPAAGQHSPSADAPPDQKKAA